MRALDKRQRHLIPALVRDAQEKRCWGRRRIRRTWEVKRTDGALCRSDGMMLSFWLSMALLMDCQPGEEEWRVK